MLFHDKNILFQYFKSDRMKFEAATKYSFEPSWKSLWFVLFVVILVILIVYNFTRPKLALATIANSK